MRNIMIGISVFAMVLAFASTQPIEAGQQSGTEGGQMPGEQQGQEIGREMLDKNIQNSEGRNLGRVAALATRDGEIAYILMSRDGNREAMIPIPFSATHFDSQRNVVILSEVDDSELAQAPSVSIDEMQRLNDPEFESQVRGYYGQEGRQGKHGMQPGSRELQQQ